MAGPELQPGFYIETSPKTAFKLPILYQLIRELGEKVNVKTRPHGIRHTSITEAVKLAQQNGYGLEEVLDHSRHVNVATLMVYRDREKDMQGTIATLVADSIKLKCCGW